MIFSNTYQSLVIRLVLTLFLILSSITIAIAQKHTTISGYLTDASSGEQLIGVNIYDLRSKLGTSTNEYGFYSLTIPSGTCELRVTSIGYETQNINVDLTKDTVINIALKEDIVEFQEVVVTAEQPKVDQSQMSLIEVPIQKLNKIPVIIGEPDILKVVQLLPGVQSGSEGTSGIHVRGGNADQNLFLLDGVPVYNASHLFGFFSVFNPGAVKTVKLYKGGFPARYGGRLSSVVDIRMKEGNDQKIKGDFSIGLISSRFNLEGPVSKGKSSFLISARRTYIDILAKPFIALANKSSENEKITGGYYFYDLNLKLNHKFSDRSRLYLSTYLGKDKLYANYEYNYEGGFYYPGEDQNRPVHKYQDRNDMGIKWGNRIAALRWNYLINNKLFSNTTITYSKYNFNTSTFWGEFNLTDKEQDTNEFDYFSNIQDIAGKVDFDYAPHPNHAMKFGAGFIAHLFEPGVQVEKITSSLNPEDNYSSKTPDNKVNTTEQYIYIEDNISLGDRWKANIGIHLSNITVQKKNYTSLQPRISARYKLKENWSLKASYAKMNQYVHLLSSSTIDLPTDLWVPVTSNLNPPSSHQYAIGTSMRLPYGLDLSVECFYKNMDNLIAYRDGASFSGTASTNWDKKVETGKGWAYGAELLLEKTVGKTTGWLGYTWAKSERRFDKLNYGKVFPSRYDRRHDISLVLTHAFSDRFDIGATWVYNTGNAVTLGAYKYPLDPSWNYEDRFYGGFDIKDYGGRNGYRMPDYHRLDIGLNFHKKTKRGTRTWSISIYNAYNNQNPFMLIWDEDRDSPVSVPVYDNEGNILYHDTRYKQVLKQISLFPIIPSISYSFKF